MHSHLDSSDYSTQILKNSRIKLDEIGVDWLENTSTTTTKKRDKTHKLRNTKERTVEKNVNSILDHFK